MIDLEKIHEEIKDVFICMGVGITELDFALEKLDEVRNA